MKYTQVGADAFKQLQLNAGILLTDFIPATGTFSAAGIIGATSGGVTFNANPNYIDIGDDIDNCPANTKQFKVVTSYDASLTGSFRSVDGTLAKALAGAVTAETVSTDLMHYTAAEGFVNKINAGAFRTIWWVGDYTDTNADTVDRTAGKVTARAGYIAIRLNNAFHTDGFQIRSNKNEKGEFAFAWHAHYDLSDLTVMPYEIYIGTPAPDA